MRANKPDGKYGEHAAPNELNGDGEEELPPTDEVDSFSLEVSTCQSTYLFFQVAQQLHLLICLYKLQVSFQYSETIFIGGRINRLDDSEE